jgi:hypothetical protein
LAQHQRQVQRAAGLVAEGVGGELALRRGSARVPIFSTSVSVRLRYSIRSAMVPIFSPCSAANSCRSGRRAMVPSSFMISQITAAGVQPAMAARSQPASVWPARISTPPRRPAAERCGPAAPGRCLCVGRHGSLHGAARSAAEMPVVTPSAASMDTVKAVPMRVPLRATMGGRCRRSQRSRVSVRQIRPRPKRHEVDGLGRDVVGRQDQVALVLAVFLVHQDDHAAGGQLGHDVLHGRDAGDAGGGGGSGWKRSWSGQAAGVPGDAAWRARAPMDKDRIIRPSAPAAGGPGTPARPGMGLENYQYRS